MDNIMIGQILCYDSVFKLIMEGCIEDKKFKLREED